MEKLQQALAQARKSRGQHIGDRTQRDALQTPGDLNGKGALWQALPVFTPDPEILDRNRVVTLHASNQSTHFGILRTKIISLMRQNNWTRIAITSPAPGCGKTTTACNLALGMGRQGDRHTMLFDLDLRRPSVAKVLAMSPKLDVTSLLAGASQPDEQMMCINTNIAVAATTGPANDPSRHLMSDRTVQTLVRLEKIYEPDVMLFDLPPLLGTEDARAFLKNVDAALLVAKAEVTTAHEVDMCEKEIVEHTNFLGVVLNQCKLPDQNDQNSYGYEPY